MDIVVLPTHHDKSSEKRSRLPWALKSKTLKSSAIFSKIKHSDEWHQSIDATAGVLHPSDPKFPWSFVRNHTDAYLQKKGKVNQADADIRLSILIHDHDAKDIAIAATAHALTPVCLRNRLRLDLNVTHATYWGLKTWLQCLLAANHGNPASVTDLEALWARELLAFVTHGPRAAEWLLVGISRLLRIYPVRSLNDLPEFSILLERAIEDFSVQLEGYRLRNEWATAFEAVRWMIDLAKSSSPNRSHGFVCPENVLDQRFSSWRVWISWQPRPEHLARSTRLDDSCKGFLSDLLALDGPDILTGTALTLKGGLIARYSGGRTYLRYRSLVIHVSDCSRITLTAHLYRATTILDIICTSNTTGPGPNSKLLLFRDLVCAQPLTAESLDILEAINDSSVPSHQDVHTIIGSIYLQRNHLCGEHIQDLTRFVQVIQEPGLGKARTLLFQPWLSSGIEKCLSECRAAVRSCIKDQLFWMDMATELLDFCRMLKDSRYNLGIQDSILQSLSFLPVVEVMQSLADILKAIEYESTKAMRPSDSKVALKNTNTNSMSTTTSSDVSTKDSSTIVTSDAQETANDTQHPLITIIEAFVVDRLIERDFIDASSQRAITSILYIWNTVVPQRRLAILSTKNITTDTDLVYRCLVAISTTDNTVTSTNFLNALLDVLCQAEANPLDAILAFANLLSSSGGWSICWRDLLHTWLGKCSTGDDDGHKIVEHYLNTMKAPQWISFMNNLSTLFAHIPKTTSEQQAQWPILQPTLLSWTRLLAQYMDPITRLETALGAHKEAIMCILRCKTWRKKLLTILACLRDVKGLVAEPLMQQVVGKLSATEPNHWDISEVCVDLLNADQETFELCSKVWDASHGRLNIPGLPQAEIQDTRMSVTKPLTKEPSKPAPGMVVPRSVVEIMVIGHITDSKSGDRCKVTLESLAKVLQLKYLSQDLTTEKVQEATEFWEKIEQQIIDEGDRLERLQKALKVKDPKGTALLLQQLGVPDHSLVDEEILRLPAGIRDFIERTGETEVEISFPIASFTELRRNAMGISKEAKTLLVRLSIDFDKSGMPSSFCAHLDSDVFAADHKHNLWICQKDKSAPLAHVCTSTQTAFVWQVNRILHMQLRDGDISLAELYTRVKKRLELIGHVCIACGLSHNATNSQIRRGIPCNLMACAQLWYQLPLDVRIPEIRTDLFAVDAMLMAVYSAAMSGKTELLVGCPIRSSESIKAILNSLPTLTVVSHAVNMSAVLKTYHPDAEKLISWAVVHHRGYIATASGICKVPTLTNVHQFILANASPKLESDFVSRLPNPNSKSTVLFHGTTFDRLPAILSQGLKVCSGTALQRTGAAHGKGIYLAEDPATSLTYAPSTMSWKNSGLTNTRLLLACEVAGSGRNVSSTIHVITDEKSVMVRYLFFLPPAVSAPLANHIVPAIASGMAALRKGVV